MLLDPKGVWRRFSSPAVPPNEPNGYWKGPCDRRSQLQPDARGPTLSLSSPGWILVFCSPLPALRLAGVVCVEA